MLRLQQSYSSKDLRVQTVLSVQPSIDSGFLECCGVKPPTADYTPIIIIAPGDVAQVTSNMSQTPNWNPVIFDNNVLAVQFNDQNNTACNLYKMGGSNVTVFSNQPPAGMGMGMGAPPPMMAGPPMGAP